MQPRSRYGISTKKRIDSDLDQWLIEYNEQRTHSGKYCYGKTPMQTFRDTVHLAKEKMLGEVAA